MDQPGEEVDDTLIWADVPEKLKERFESKPQQITESCLLENTKAILRLYENDITQHVVKQQLRGDRMDEFLRRQITYQEGGVKQQRRTRTTVNRLAKSTVEI